MKTIITTLLLTIVLFGYSQSANKTKNLSIPDFTISTIKDSTDFNSKSLPKDGILLIKYFSPDCGHCQDEAQLYVSKKDSLQNIKTVWLSGDWATLKMVKEFAETYKLEQINPIAIGKETNGYLLSLYKIDGIPFTAVYKDNTLIKEYRGDVDFDELIAINNGTFTLDSSDD